MSVLIQILDAHKSYGQQVLLDGASMTLHEGNKVGFVGRNGAGKSTLLKVMLGEEELDSGKVQHNSRLKVGYLRQHSPFLDGESGMDFLIRDSGQPNWRCGEVAAQFELKGAYLEDPVLSLSGGWQTRVKLAALLLQDPNLLLLDEPTNFLDLRTQLLLEEFLKSFRKACLIVSHDRTFLKATCDQTLDLTAGKLTLYPGKVDDFLTYQEEKNEHDRRSNASVIAKQQHLQRFIDKNKARASTATQARSKTKQLEKLKTVDIAADLPTANIIPPKVKPRHGTAFRCEGLTIGYPDHTVASDVLFEIEHGQRVAIVGDNGQGKTTLLRTLVGSLEPLDGEVKWGFGCKHGVYAQHVYSSLPEHFTVMDYLQSESLPGTTHQDILAQAGALLFRGEAVEKKIKVLSGGERARLCMAGILLSDSNILVLDEPGNHLDVQTVESLAEALKKFEGTVVFTSHDRHFMNLVATNVVEVRDRSVRNYLGNYSSYLQSVTDEVERGQRERQSGPAKGKNEPKKASSGGGSQDHKILRKKRKELSNLEKKIAELDGKKTEIQNLLNNESDPGKAMDFHNEVTAIQSQLSEMEENWFELHTELEGEV